MKRFLFIIIVIFLSFPGAAQNYQCLQSGVRHYFTNAAGYLRGIRIDSIRASGSDFLHYPFHTPRGAYSVGTWTLLDSTAGSWLGKKVVEKSDGTFLFDNIWSDTVFIRAKASVGSSWVFYNDATPQYYVANVVSNDTMTVLGTLDSVKAIIINSYNGSGLDLSDSLNNFKIILSKNHGFVQVFDLYTFPYHAPGSVYVSGNDHYLDVVVNDIHKPSKSNSIFHLTDFFDPTWAQLYDRNPGDVFEYEVYEPVETFPMMDPAGSYYPYQYYLDSITAKVSFPDSVQYGYSGWLATQAIDPYQYYYPYIHYTYNMQSVSKSQAFTNALVIDTALMPEEFNQPVLQYYFPVDTAFCTSGAAYRFIENSIGGSYWMGFFEATPVSNTYKIGFGLLRYYYYDAGNDAVHSKILVYSVKSGASCGGFVAPTLVQVVNANWADGFKAYPNPAFESIIVSSANEKIETITISNLRGQTLSCIQSNAWHVQVNVAGLPPGIYLLKINGSEVRQFIKR
jgi:hypothetical protein